MCGAACAASTTMIAPCSCAQAASRAAPDGMQKSLVDADPERFFVPPYVGHRGWLGFRLDRELDWNELAGIVEDAYADVAPPKLVESLVTDDLD